MRIISTKLFGILCNVPLLGGFLTLIFVVPIMNNKQLLSPQAREGVMMQLFVPIVYVIGRTTSYLLWLIFGLMTLEKVISWISLAWLLLCYVYMILGVFRMLFGANFSYNLFRLPLRLIERLLWH